MPRKRQFSACQSNFSSSQQIQRKKKQRTAESSDEVISGVLSGEDSSLYLHLRVMENGVMVLDMNDYNVERNVILGTSNETEGRQDSVAKRARCNRSFVKQVRKRLSKWYSKTNTPACVLYLRGGSVACEGPEFLKKSFGQNVDVQRKFLNAVLNNDHNIQSAAGRSSENDDEHYPVSLPPVGGNYKVEDLRKIITSCVTTGKNGYVSPNWGKVEHRPCWWPEEIPFVSPCTGRSKVTKTQLVRVMECYRSFYASPQQHTNGSAEQQGQLPGAHIVPPQQHASGNVETMTQEEEQLPDAHIVPPQQHASGSVETMTQEEGQLLAAPFVPPQQHASGNVETMAQEEGQQPDAHIVPPQQHASGNEETMTQEEEQLPAAHIIPPQQHASGDVETMTQEEGQLLAAPFVPPQQHASGNVETMTQEKEQLPAARIVPPQQHTSGHAETVTQQQGQVPDAHIVPTQQHTSGNAETTTQEEGQLPAAHIVPAQQHISGNVETMTQEEEGRPSPSQ